MATAGMDDHVTHPQPSGDVNVSAQARHVFPTLVLVRGGHVRPQERVRLRHKQVQLLQTAPCTLNTDLRLVRGFDLYEVLCRRLKRGPTLVAQGPQRLVQGLLGVQTGPDGRLHEIPQLSHS